jgi:hypothetical protein
MHFREGCSGVPGKAFASEMGGVSKHCELRFSNVESQSRNIGRVCCDLLVNTIPWCFVGGGIGFHECYIMCIRPSRIHFNLDTSPIYSTVNHLPQCEDCGVR